MGWLYSERWPERSDLIKHLTEGNGIKTLKHCCVGNNLWCVHEAVHQAGSERAGEVIRFVCLYKMQKHGGSYPYWGYKDIDESAGPGEISCPVSYLTMCTYPVNQYAYDWRQAVYARHEKLRQVKVGTKWKISNTIYEVVARTAKSTRVKDVFGQLWRAPLERFVRGELVP